MRSCRSKVLVAGLYDDGDGDNLIVARFLAEGVLDTTFGTSGIETYAPLPGVAVASCPVFGKKDVSIAVAPNRTIFAAGHLDDGNDMKSLLVAFNQDGSPLTTFGSSGVLIEDHDCASSACNAADEKVTEVLVQSDGKIVTVGHYGIATLNEGSLQVAATHRYTATGTLDTSFGGGDGKFIYAGGHENALGWQALGGTLQGDGKIVVVGRELVSSDTLIYGLSQ